MAGGKEFSPVIANDEEAPSQEQPTTSRRPLQSGFLQQTLPSWEPALTPFFAYVFLFVIGICFIPTGADLIARASDYYVKTIVYDGSTYDVNCVISTAEQGRKCQVQFNIDTDVDGPLYLYYELTDYYQNHRQYASSKDTLQLSAYTSTCDWLTSLGDHKTENGSLKLNPCGLVAASYFNDVISLATSGRVLDEKDIAWASDRDNKFKQPSGFVSKANPSLTSCDTLLGKIGASAYTDSSGVSHCYWYPEDASTQYLHETYKQISPLKGVTDEHFIVWMRTASLPTFRKLYGKIEGDFKKGEVLAFNVTANFLVSHIDSSKALVLTTQGEFGNKNKELGVLYVTVGTICMFFSALFFVKHKFFPRAPASELVQKWAHDEAAK